MKVIVSHDVDHITAWEHRSSLIVPKSIGRSIIEFGLGYVSAPEVINRFKSIIQNKWHNLEELMEFNKNNKIPATYFIGVANGRYLQYSLKNAEFWIKRISDQGFDVGVHGITYGELQGIRREYELFRSLSGRDKFGIRMHYLMNSYETLDYLSRAGYVFDSTLYAMSNPYKKGNLWEFPVHIMDAYIFCKGQRWQNQCLQQAQETTKKIIEQALNIGITYFTILFHDMYFTDSYRTWKNWFIWIISYLRETGCEFVSYSNAIDEMSLQ